MLHALDKQRKRHPAFANRRIEIVIVPDLSGLPGFDELNEMAKPVRVQPKR